MTQSYFGTCYEHALADSRLTLFGNNRRYCFYYYYARSDMSGFMQTSFFFGYMWTICYGFFLMLGNVGFRASKLFVMHIYKAIKCE